MQKQKIWNVPNVLTMIRALLIPVYWVLFTNEKRLWALAVFAFASLTDLADGYIARKYNLITDFGKLMDPLADKLMVISVMLSLVLAEILPVAALVILIAKEALMVLGGMILLRHHVVVHSEMIGKVAQVTVVIALILCFFEKYFLEWGFPLHRVVVWIAVALTLCALVFYAVHAVQRYIKTINEEKQENV